MQARKPLPPLLSQVLRPVVVVAACGDEGVSRTWLHGDKRGSIVALANNVGAATQINTYGIWGAPMR